MLKSVTSFLDMMQRLLLLDKPIEWPSVDRRGKASLAAVAPIDLVLEGR